MIHTPPRDDDPGSVLSSGDRWTKVSVAGGATGCRAALFLRRVPQAIPGRPGDA